VMVRWLCQTGLDAKAFDTEYGEEDDESTGTPAAEGDKQAATPADGSADASAGEEANDA
jgi:putative mRNA 3-end processing factor